MAPKTKLLLPTMSTLSNSTKLDSTDASVRRIFSRLSQTSLLELVFVWLEGADKACTPRLDSKNGEENLGYTLANSLEELRALYEELKKRKGDKEDVLNRVLDGDWRHGISLQQLAMADTQYLLDHPSSQRWIAWKPVNTIEESKRARSSEVLEETLFLAPPPKFHESSFLQNLQRDIGSIVKSHYYVSRIASLCITLLRVQTFDTPFRSLRANNAKKGPIAPNATIFIAFPDNSPLIFTSLNAQTSDAKTSEGNAMRKLVIDALPGAFARPGERYRLEATPLSAKSLSALSATCDTEHDTTAHGGWSIFATGAAEGSPLHFLGANADRRDRWALKVFPEGKDSSAQTKRTARSSSNDDHLNKRRRLIAQARFGTSALETDGKGAQVLEIQIQDSHFWKFDHRNESSAPIEQVHSPACDASTQRSRSILHPEAALERSHSVDKNNEPVSYWTPKVQLRFHGSHVFAGIRKLVEAGAIDGKEMPGWMTGEDGVSVGVVREGRIVGADSMV